MLKVGLTGGIACGKSHVLARLAAAGLPTLDLDAVGHAAIAPGSPAYDDVVAAFGPEILGPDGRVDRKALGDVVFTDAAARARLNAIVHPRVRAEETRWVAAQAVPVAVVDAALLVESGVHLRFDRLAVVHCDEAAQLRRLMQRDGIGETAARARIAAQMPIAEKRRFAHLEVDTSSRRADTDAAADRLAETLRGLGAAPRVRAHVRLEAALGCLLHGPERGPRGLDPRIVLGEIATAHGLEMERVARRLDPPAAGPWYRVSRSGEGGPRPETLVGAVALWAAGRGSDSAFVVAAAASLARLTHVESDALADAGLLALVLHRALAEGRVPRDLPERLPAWSGLAARWGGVAPSGRLDPVWRAALAHPADLAAAREACRRDGGDADLAGALVGVAVGADPGAAPADLAQSVLGLLSADA